MYLILADIVLIIHFLFIVFVVGGWLLVLRWPNLSWFHLPAVAWGAIIEIMGWICPLTSFENRLREMGYAATYQGDFVAQYLLPIIYPDELTPAVQTTLGIIVITINTASYVLIKRACRLRRRHEIGSQLSQVQNIHNIL